MAGLTPLPPTVHHSSTRLTHAQAHVQLSDFLSLAENDAAFRPDSTLTERGPQSASTGANPNLTLHHLKRILQGLEGKRIGGLQDVDRFFGEGAISAGVGGRGLKRKHDEEGQAQQPSGNGDTNSRQTHATPSKKKFVEEADTQDFNEDLGVAVENEDQEGWQDKELYEQAQDDVVDAMEHERNPGMLDEQPANAHEADEMMEVEIEETGDKVQPTPSNGIDKTARKAAKAAKRKQEAREKNKAHAKK